MTGTTVPSELTADQLAATAAAAFGHARPATTADEAEAMLPGLDAVGRWAESVVLQNADSDGDGIGDLRGALESGQERAAALQAMMAPVWDTYDVVVDESPSSPSVKDRSWAAVQQALPILMPMVQAGQLPPVRLGRWRVSRRASERAGRTVRPNGFDRHYDHRSRRSARHDQCGQRAHVRRSGRYRQH